MNIMDKKILLMILDGWGLTSETVYSAIAQARTPFLDYLYKKYPHTQLEASGLAVGLPEHQMGNSEVGHMHIGAGRIILQDLVRINAAIKSGELATNLALVKEIEYAKQQKKAIHLIGLVSNGGVHSHINHLKALCAILKSYDVSRVFIHAFTDGRDTDPHSGIDFLQQVENYTQYPLASIMGRYYAMDRDNRWERVKVAYDALVDGIGIKTSNWKSVIEESYNANVTDEFLQPIILTYPSGEPVATIQPEDVVICFNFRTDRSRQITEALTQFHVPDFAMKPLDIHYLTLTVYDETFRNVTSIFKNSLIANTLGEVVSKYGKKQLRIAETEKYPHVTYFFSGGREAPFPGEERILCPSPKVATYNLDPAMSAHKITQQLNPLLEDKAFDFICLNFANADMVGHTGIWHATIAACEVVDSCVQEIVTKSLKNGYSVLIVSDHGNAEKMLQDGGGSYTAHTSNPVPCIFIEESVSNSFLRTGSLIDIAPTILKCMNLPIPEDMQGKPLY